MLLKGLIPLIFGQKNGNLKQILVSNWVSVHLMEVSVSVSVSKFYSLKVSVSISVSKFYNWKVSVSYRYRRPLQLHLGFVGRSKLMCQKSLFFVDGWSIGPTLPVVSCQFRIWRFIGLIEAHCVMFFITPPAHNYIVYGGMIAFLHLTWLEFRPDDLIFLYKLNTSSVSPELLHHFLPVLKEICTHFASVFIGCKLILCQ